MTFLSPPGIKGLKSFQTDSPMVSLMSDTLEALTTRLLKTLIKNTIVDDASNVYKSNNEVMKLMMWRKESWV